jgi:uroporphyrin-III C-methyltransferase
MTQTEIQRLMVEHARKGRRVVRLKGGDPFVFGRGAEELDACREAGVPCRVVPGVSSAVAVPAAAGIPVTERGIATSFAVLTGQSEAGTMSGGLVAKAQALAAIDTLVILMGRSALWELTAAIVAAGRDPETPVACIQDGTTPRQRVVAGTLTTIASLVEQAGLDAPMVTVIGEVAARAGAPVPC